MEYLIYSLLFVVLIAFIGVIGYIVYDNYTYKNNLTTDLNTNFVDINKNFYSTSNIIRRLDNKHTSNYNVLDGKIDNTSNVLYGIIDNTSNLLDRRIYDSSNLLDGSIKEVNRNSTKMFDTFGYNMNKYFAFNNTNTANAFNETTNKKIFEYRTVPTDTNSRLELITKTTASAGLKISSVDSNNGLEVCNKTGTNCFNMYGNDNDLYIYGTSANNMNRNIYIGSNDKTKAPISIENDVVKVNNVNINTLRTDVDTIRKDVDALRGTNTGGANTGGANTGGANTGGANTGGTNTGGTNTGGTNTGGTNTGGTNTGGTNTGGTNTGGTNTGGTNTGGTNTV